MKFYLKEIWITSSHYYQKSNTVSENCTKIWDSQDLKVVKFVKQRFFWQNYENNLKKFIKKVSMFKE